MINTELKFHQSTTTPDGVGLMLTSHDCEDDESVDGSAISPATVHVLFFVDLLYLRTNACTVVCIDLFQAIHHRVSHVISGLAAH